MIHSPDITIIRRTFAERFDHWGLELPGALPPEGQAGTLRGRGWTINYHFIHEGDQPCLEYYASHRMTNDTLNRIYADGRYELVDAAQEFYLLGDDESLRRYHEHNRSFTDRVQRLGLWAPWRESGA